jgi:hypothetical protein
LDTARHEHWLHAQLEESPPPVDVFSQTAEFADTIMGLSAPQFPTRIEPGRKRWACGAFREEVQEFEDATTIEDEADALADLIYFAAGRFHEMGLDGRAHFNLVHAANMLKKKGELSKRPFSKGYDAVKPDGWTPPDHGPLVEARRPKIILLGYARHGKDTVAEMLRDRYGLRFQSSSMFCAEKVLMPHFSRYPLEGEYSHTHDRVYRSYRSVNDCYADRVNFRDVWYDQIEAYNSPDKARLCRELFAAGNDIYVGMRSAEEFRAAEALADLVVWVDRSQHLPPEDKSSCTVTPNMADYVLDNNGTLDDLAVAVAQLVEQIEVVNGR